MTSRVLSLLVVFVFVTPGHVCPPAAAILAIRPSPGLAAVGSSKDARINRQAEPDLIGLFEEVLRLCRDYFYSPTITPDWESLEPKYRPLVERAASEQEAVAVINMMLSELKASHTRLYTRSDWEYYDLLDLFDGVFAQEIKQLFPEGKAAYASVGLFTRKIQGKTFVKAVLDGSPASKAGILAGDEIRSIDGTEYDAVRSFTGKTAVTLWIQRKLGAGPMKKIRVVPECRNPGERYMDAMRASARVIRDSDCNVGYIHAWSFAGEQYYLELLAQIRDGSLKGADALILDLRDGWGGANPYYLSPFDPAVPTEVPSGDGKNRSIAFKWKRPVVLLVNEGTRSGKETLTYRFKRRRLGIVVGSTTAGADAAGRPFFLKRGGLLMLAVKPQATIFRLPESDPIPPGAIEGKGVVPDIAVEFPLEYAAGKDPQLEMAVRAAVRSVRSLASFRE